MIYNCSNSKTHSETNDYLLPVDLLDCYDRPIRNADENDLNKTALLNAVARHTDSAVRHIETISGRSFTTYVVELDSRAALNKLDRRIDDIAEELGLSGRMRVNTPVCDGGTSAGIEIADKSRKTVGLREMLELYDGESPLAIPVGVDARGKHVYCDLRRTPCVLAAGCTGSGKSSFVNSAILSLLFSNSADALKFVLIDTKRVEYAQYEGLPHLFENKILYCAAQAESVFDRLIEEAERRTALFAQENCRDITEYNATAENRLPEIAVIIDELSDLTTDAVLQGLYRLAVSSRTAGIYIIAVTQRVTPNILTDAIRSSFAARIAFGTVTELDSKLILGVRGAESLSMRGDLIYVDATSPYPVRAQGAYVSGAEIERVVKAATEYSVKAPPK